MRTRNELGDPGHGESRGPSRLGGDVIPKATIADLLGQYPTIGGVWSKDRIYPTLRSNNQLGTLELPDYPMHEGFGVKPKNHIPGRVVHKYLCEYAENFGLTSRIRFNSKALSAEKEDDGRWKLHVVPTETDVGGKEYELFCNKLIIATGLTSRPVSCLSKRWFIMAFFSLSTTGGSTLQGRRRFWRTNSQLSRAGH